MRLAWLFRRGMAKDSYWELWGAISDKPTPRVVRQFERCNTFAPAFRLVTVESAREDYGIKVPSLAEVRREIAGAKP